MEHIMKFVTMSGLINLRYVLLAGSVFLLVYVLLKEKLAKSKIQKKRNARKKDFLREIKHSLQSGVIFAAMAVIVQDTPFKEYTLIYENPFEYGILWIPISILMALAIQDTYFYWMHRAVHYKPLYLKIHAVHHKSNNPTPWASYSFHFLEAILEGAVLFIIVMILPIHFYGILGFTIGGFLINLYGHLGYEVAPKWFRNSFLFEIMNTSVHHNMHHKHFKGNYGLYFRFWDRLLRTEHPDYVKEYDRIQEERFGKENEAVQYLPIHQDKLNGKQPVTLWNLRQKTMVVFERIKMNGKRTGRR